jgi:hypothetical protein
MAEKENGFEEAGLCVAGAKNMPVACFLGRGRIHCLMDAPGTGVNIRLLFVVVRYRNSIYSIVFTKHK